MEKSKILFVAHSGPFPPNDGKRQRTFALLKALEEKYTIDYVIVQHKTDYLAAQQGYVSDSVRFLFIEIKQTLGKRLLKKAGIVFIKNPEVKSFLAKLMAGNTYQLAFTRYMLPVIDIPSGIKIIADIDDDFNEVYASRIRQEAAWIKKIRLRQIWLMNLFIYNRLLNKLTKAIYVKKENSSSENILLPNFPFQLLWGKPIAFQSCTAPRILFVGKLSYAPNLEGILWFLNKVWPSLLMELPQIELTVVSSNPCENDVFQSILKGSNRIHFRVNVNSLEEVYQNHAICVAPVFNGGGSSIKLAESLYMARPVVTSTFGCRGFENARDLGVVFPVDSDVAFKNKILYLFNHTDELQQLQRKAYSWAHERYSFTAWKSLILNSI